MRREHVPLPVALLPCCLFPTLLLSSAKPLSPPLSHTHGLLLSCSLAWFF
uniref:Uncharacterized protein n=1 Tax=Arundo donax TaxID=35708 RepID=A0A0A9FWR1_ARUDO